MLALTKELQDKIKEVEARAEWLKSQRLVVQQYAFFFFFSVTLKPRVELYKSL